MNRNPRLFIKKILVTLISVLIIGYAIFNARLLIWGPQIHDITPPDSSTFETNFITVSGSTQNIATITLNDKTIFIDESGLFSKDILLLSGLNIVELYGKDKFGRETRTLLNYFYTGEGAGPILEIHRLDTDVEDIDTEDADPEETPAEETSE